MAQINRVQTVSPSKRISFCVLVSVAVRSIANRPAPVRLANTGSTVMHGYYFSSATAVAMTSLIWVSLSSGKSTRVSKSLPYSGNITRVPVGVERLSCTDWRMCNVPDVLRRYFG
nr:hypothetical protein [Enterobacter cloacae complex sp. I2]